MFGRYVPVTVIHGRGSANETRTHTLAGGDIHSRLLIKPDVKVRRGDEIHACVLDEPRIVDEVKPFVGGSSVDYFEVLVVPRSACIDAGEVCPERSLSSKLRAILSDAVENVLEACDVHLDKFVKAYDLPGVSIDQDDAPLLSAEKYVEDLEESYPFATLSLAEALLAEMESNQAVFYTMKRGVHVSPFDTAQKAVGP